MFMVNVIEKKSGRLVSDFLFCMCLRYCLFIINWTENLQVPNEEVKCVNDWRYTKEVQASLAIIYLPMCV